MNASDVLIFVNMYRAEDRPNGSTVNSKNSVCPSISHENPKNLRCPGAISIWWYPALRSKDIKKEPCEKYCTPIFQSSILKWSVLTFLFNMLRSRINLFLFLLLLDTERGLTIYDGDCLSWTLLILLGLLWHWLQIPHFAGLMYCSCKTLEAVSLWKE